MKTKKNRTVLFFGMLLLLCAPNLSAQSLGYKLAMVQTGKVAIEDDLLTKRFNSLLKQLDEKYTENQTQIADMTVTAKNELNKEGISQPMINIMESINLLIDLKTKVKSYADNITVYIILRHQGHNHVDAIKNLQDLLTLMSMQEIKKALGIG